MTEFNLLPLTENETIFSRYCAIAQKELKIFRNFSFFNSLILFGQLRNTELKIFRNFSFCRIFFQHFDWIIAAKFTTFASFRSTFHFLPFCFYSANWSTMLLQIFRLISRVSYALSIQSISFYRNYVVHSLRIQASNFVHGLEFDVFVFGLMLERSNSFAMQV